MQAVLTLQKWMILSVTALECREQLILKMKAAWTDQAAFQGDAIGTGMPTPNNCGRQLMPPCDCVIGNQGPLEANNPSNPSGLLQNAPLLQIFNNPTKNNPYL